MNPLIFRVGEVLQRITFLTEDITRTSDGWPSDADSGEMIVPEEVLVEIQDLIEDADDVLDEACECDMMPPAMQASTREELESIGRAMMADPGRDEQVPEISPRQYKRLELIPFGGDEILEDLALLEARRVRLSDVLRCLGGQAI